MSDDVNKSNKKINGKAPRHIEEAFAAREEAVDYGSLASRDDVGKLANRLEEKESRLHSIADKSSDEYKHAEQDFQLADYQLEEKMGGYAQRYNDQLANTISTYTKTKNIDQRTTTMSSQQRFIKEAKSNKDLYLPTEQLQGRNQTLMEEATMLGTELAGRSRGLGREELPDSLKEKSNRITSIQDEIALNKRIQKEQSRQGLSTEKLTNRGEDLNLTAQQFIEKKSLEQKVDSGNVKSYKEELSSLKEAQFNRNKLQEDYNSAIEDGGSMASTFAEKLKQANDALDTQTKIVKRMSDKGMDKDGGVGGFFNKHGAMLQGAAFVGTSVANVARNVKTIAVDQDITQMNNRAGFAALGNQMYNKAEQAVMNDNVDSAVDLLTTPDFAKQYADRNRKIAHKAGWTSSIGDSIGNIAGGIAKGAMIGGGVGLAVAGIGAIPGAIGGGIIGGVSAASSSVTSMTNLAYGNDGAAASFASDAAIKNLSAEARKIKTYQMQKYYNQNLNTYEGGMGLGNSQAAGMQGELTDTATLDKLALTGIGANQATRLSSMLRSAGDFGGAKAGVSILESAGKAGQSGTMGREEYLGAAARMISMGGSNDDLQDIITKGMDNSKNISQMVDASMQMSAGLASMGVSGIGTTQDMLSASVKDLLGIGVNENIATGTALSSMQNLSESFQTKGMTFGNIIERAELKRTKGLESANVHQMNSLSELSLEDIAVLRKGGAGGRRLASRKGIKDLVYNQDGTAKNGVMDSIAGAALKGAITDASGTQFAESMINKTKSGKDFTQEENAIANAIKTDQIAMRRTYSSETGNITKKEAQLNGAGSEVIKRSREAKEIASGEGSAKSLGGESAYKNIENMMAAVNEAINPKEFSETVSRAAKDFEIPVLKFGEHVTAMGKILSKHSEILQSMGESRGPKIHYKKK